MATDSAGLQRSGHRGDIVVLMFRPAVLFRPGAQLSFLAVATLIWLSLNYRSRIGQPLDQLIRRSRPWYERLVMITAERAYQLALAGMAIWLVTLPLVMFRFHLLSPISLVLNVVLAIPIAIGLLSGFGVLVTGNTMEPVAAVCGWVCDGSLALVESTVLWAHEVPGAYFWVAGPQAYWCAVFYIGVSLMAFVPRLRPTRMWVVAWFLLWLTIPAGCRVVNNVYHGDSRQLRCAFLSVGHGTCVVIEMPDNRVLLYDCGRMGMPQTGVRLVSEYLWHRGVSHIDGAVISHADADHYNILPGLLDRFSVGRVLTSPLMFQSKGPGVAVLYAAITDAEIPITPIQTNDTLRFGETKFRVLHPLPTGVDGSDNANSIVLELEHQGKKVLLPGDLEAPGLEEVVAEAPRDCDVLMAPHHGSLRSPPTEFTRWCSPEYVVISGGRNAEHGNLQHAIYSELGVKAFHTAESGAATVMIRDGVLTVRAYLPQQVR